jgi:hypothetical protein
VRRCQLSNIGNQSAIWRVVYNPATLTGGNFSALASGSSPLLFDTSATTYTGGTQLFGPMHPQNWSEADEISVDQDWYLNPGDSIVFACAASTGTITAAASAVTIADK